MDERKKRNAPSGNRPSVLPMAILVSILTATATTGCRGSQIVPTAINSPSGSDPSDANLAPVASQPPAQNFGPAPRNVRVLASQQSYTPQQSSEQYPQQQYPQQPPAPIERQDPSQAYDNSADSYDSGEADGYEALADASQPPPPLPDYDQPPVPEPNDLWTPGYWNYAPQGYYWVPGAWVAPPYLGALWTPAYWGYDGGRYRLHRGFWARHIGFYGGINYGFGYTGIGYSGGYWNGGDFFYNRAVNRVNITNIHNVYERNIIVNNRTRISYNGGNGGINARPDPRELAVLRERRTPPMATQVQLRETSSQNRQQFYNENHGRPAQPFAEHPIPAVRTVQTLPGQTFQQHPQPLSPPFNQQQRTPSPQQEAQRPQPFSQQQRNPNPQQEQQQQRFEQQHQTLQNQPLGRSQPQQQQPAQTPTQQDQQRFSPHNNHQQPASLEQRPQQQPDADQQRQRFQQQQQADQQQRLQQQQRTNPPQAEPQRVPQQRAPQAQPQQPAQPRPEFQSRPQPMPAPQPQRLQAKPQFRPQPQQQPRQEAPRAEPRK